MSKAETNNPTILLVGAGAVGATIATWLAPHHNSFYVLDQGETLENITKNGVVAYQQYERENAEKAHVKTISSLKDAPTPDIILLCVKNYSLDGLAQGIKDLFGDHPIVVGLQNGVENQSILPKYFSKVIYGIITYNAWLDEPGVAGYQKRGPIVFGTLDNGLQVELKLLQKIFQAGVETVITDHLMDAALSKMIINLTNSFTTLIGFTVRPVKNRRLFQTILSQLTYEGVQIVKGAGHKECKLGGMPPWILIAASSKLPQLITRPLFEKNVRKMVISSMEQDVIQNHRGHNELESINGFLLNLAQQHDVSAPFNEAIYALCQREFAQKEFAPMTIEAVWEAIQAYKKGAPIAMDAS